MSKFRSLVFVSALAISACSYTKPACEVVDIAHAACEYITVEYVDDKGEVQRENVPRSEFRDAAIRARYRRVAPGGAP